MECRSAVTLGRACRDFRRASPDDAASFLDAAASRKEPPSKNALALARWNVLVFAPLFCTLIFGCSPPEPAATTLRPAMSRILQTTLRLTTEIVTLRTTETPVVTMPDHPFARLGAGWTAASGASAAAQDCSTRGAHAVAVVASERRSPARGLTS
jgi:hypothetical protein